jgi:hypothetical protein
MKDLSADIIASVISLIHAGKSHRAIKYQTGVSLGSISQICAGKHATLHNFRFIFRTSRSSRTLRFPYTEVLSSLGFRPDLDMLLLPIKYL